MSSSDSQPVASTAAPACRGRFIVFEGIDGSGTTTQCQLLSARLTAAGLPVTPTREPGGTPLGEKIRSLLLDSGNPMTGVTEMLLYAAARAQHVAELIRPALRRGDVVVSDRFLDSSIAYQGHGRGLGPGLVEQINAPAVAGCMPDLVVYLDLPVAAARQRLQQRASPTDRLEAEGDRFQEIVARAFRHLADGGSERALVLDAAQPREWLAGAVWSALLSRWPASRANAGEW